MECFETTDFDNNSRLITLSAIIISGLHCIYIYIYICAAALLFTAHFLLALADLITKARHYKAYSVLWSVSMFTRAVNTDVFCIALKRGGSSVVGRGLAGYGRPDHD
jgi:hypothetical protein